MEDVKYITIDGIDFIIVDEIIINNIKYVFLVSEKESSDLRIKKVNIINNEEYLVNLNDEEEFKKALEEFNKKNNV
ncbi:hypothetical protein EGR52_12950 [bacterium]|nr:hypothetical protein [bacterium]